MEAKEESPETLSIPKKPVQKGERLTGNNIPAGQKSMFAGSLAGKTEGGGHQALEKKTARVRA